MRIIVPVKQVPETRSMRMDENTGTVIREGVESIINPLDLYAVELALRIQAETGGETIALSMGPAEAVEALKEAISMGINRGVLISDRAFSGSDTWATSHILAEAVKRIGTADLIICGERATDGDTGQVGPGMAAWLDIPVISYVNKLGEISSDSCTVHRLTEEGVEVSRCGFPLLMTVVKEVSSPRLPTLHGKKRAKQMEIPVWSNKELELDTASIGLKGSPTRVAKIFRPEIARNCEWVRAEDESGVADAGEKFLGFLLERGLI